MSYDPRRDYVRAELGALAGRIVPSSTQLYPAILAVISAAYRIDQIDLVSKRKTRHIVLPRHMAVYLARTISGEPMSNVGAVFGGVDHSTVWHACDRVRMLAEGYAPIAEDLRALRTLIETLTGLGPVVEAARND